MRRETLIAAIAILITASPTLLAVDHDIRDGLDYLAEINRPLPVMHVEEGIVPRQLGARLAEAIEQVIA